MTLAIRICTVNAVILLYLYLGTAKSAIKSHCQRHCCFIILHDFTYFFIPHALYRFLRSKFQKGTDNLERIDVIYFNLKNVCFTIFDTKKLTVFKSQLVFSCWQTFSEDRLILVHSGVWFAFQFGFHPTNKSFVL